MNKQDAHRQAALAAACQHFHPPDGMAWTGPAAHGPSAGRRHGAKKYHVDETEKELRRGAVLGIPNRRSQRGAGHWQEQQLLMKSVNQRKVNLAPLRSWGSS